MSYVPSEYFQVEWVGGISGIPVVPRPLVPKGKRWTAAGALASEVVKDFPPCVSYPLIRSDGSRSGDLVLEYRDKALDALWAADQFRVNREWIESVRLVYFVIRDRELRLRYERSYGDEHFRLPEEVQSRLGELEAGASHDDGIFFCYSVNFDPARMPEDLFALDHETLAERCPIPLCRDEAFTNVRTEREGQARYHLKFDMPDGEMIVEALFRSDQRGYFPAIVCGKNFKDVEASEELRCPKCQALVGTYPELLR